MAADALEEKILKIRQQNEEIRKRHEEVEADKKNAAQLNALVKLSPSTDWPKRKEPFEFSSALLLPPSKSQPKPRNPPRAQQVEQNNQYRPGIAGGSTNGSRKFYTYPQNEGPPPDPKYNFLADSEREEQRHADNSKNNVKIRGTISKSNKNSFRNKTNDKKDLHGSDYYNHDDNSLDESHPDYEAWRIERKKIDEARINRQITSDGNWRREWDNDKNFIADVSKKENDRFIFHNNERHDHGVGDGDKYYLREQEKKNSHHTSLKNYLEFNYDEQVGFADNKNNNYGLKTLKNSLTSAKVSASNIAGTGRLSPCQRTQMMYRSQSGGESSSSTFKMSTFYQASLDNRPDFSHKTRAKSPHLSISKQKRDTKKSSFSSRKDNKFDKYDCKSLKSQQYSGKKDFENFYIPSHTSRQRHNQNYPLKYSKSHQTFELSRNNSVNFSDAYKIEQENIKLTALEEEKPIERQIDDEKRLKDNQDQVFEALTDFKEITRNFESNNFENVVHDDSGYVETTCDSSANVKMTEIPFNVTDNQESIDHEFNDFHENKEHFEPVEEKIPIFENCEIDHQVIDSKIDHFIDKQVKKQTSYNNIDLLCKDENGPDKKTHNYVLKDIAAREKDEIRLESEDIQIGNKKN